MKTPSSSSSLHLKDKSTTSISYHGSGRVSFIMIITMVLLTMLSIETLIVFTKAATITQYVHNIAGGGFCDGIPANESILHSPSSATINSKGEIIIADSVNNLIRKVDVNGIISTIAGNGLQAYNGDHIDATSASLNNPYQVIVNDQDEVIFSDCNNNRVRKILANGKIITIAGNGVPTPLINNVEATSATLSAPRGLAFNSNKELIIADMSNYLIRKILTNGTITTVATFAKPMIFLAVSANDEIYLVENNLLHKILTNGTILTLAGQGNYLADNQLAVESVLSGSFGLAIPNNGTGELHLVDMNRIRKITNDGKITTVGGSSFSNLYNGEDISAIAAHISPYGIMFTPDNELLFADCSNNRVRKITKYGTVKTIAGNGLTFGASSAVYPFCGDGKVQAINAPLNGVNGVAINSKEEIIFSDYFAFGHVIRKISKNGILSTIAGISGLGGYNGDYIDARLAKLNGPKGIVVTNQNEVIFADSSNHRVRKILTNGTIITIAGNGNKVLVSEPVLAVNATLNTPSDVAITPDGEILIADSLNNRIVKILTNGTFITIAGIPGVSGKGTDGVLATNCTLNSPNGVSVTSSAEILIADSNNHRVRKILTNGTIITIAGTGTNGKGASNILATKSALYYPSKAIEDSNQIYIVDKSNHRIRKILTNGTITTIAGTGSNGYNGNGLASLSSQFDSPVSIAIKSNGDLIVADSGNSLIRKVSTSRMCDNILASDPNVCNGNGECIDFDTCKCNDNVSGVFCHDDSNLGNSTNLENSTLSNNSSVNNNTSNNNNNNNNIGNNNSTIDNSTNNNNTIGTSTISNSTNGNNNTNDNSNASNNNTNITNGNLTDINNNNTNNNSNTNISNNTNTNNNSNNNTGNNSNNSNNNTNTNNNSNNSNNSNNNTNTNSNPTNNNTGNNSNNSNNSDNNTNTNNNSNPSNNNTTNSNDNTQNTNTTNNSNNTIIITCYGILNSSTSVCNGNGKCLSNNSCQCNANSFDGYWTGFNCSKCLLNYEISSNCKYQSPQQSSQLITDNSNNLNNFKTNSNNNYFAFFAFVITIPILVVCALALCLIVFCVFKRRRKNEKNEIVKASTDKDVELEINVA